MTSHTSLAGLADASGCPDDCGLVAELASATGASPLAVNLGPAMLEDGHIVGVRVMAAPEAVGPAEVRASPGQDFSLTGDLVFA